LFEEYARAGGEKLSEFGVHYCYDQLREMRENPPLQAVVREALRQSLEEVRRGLDPDQRENYVDWFENWAERLNGSGPIVVDPLSNVADLLASNALSSDQTEIQLILDQLFRNMMERLDGEARAMRSAGESGDLSITAAHSFRLVPDELLGILIHELLAALDARFRNLVACQSTAVPGLQSSRASRITYAPPLPRSSSTRSESKNKVSEFSRFSRTNSNTPRMKSASHSKRRLSHDWRKSST
jgi:hypothetical protein